MNAKTAAAAAAAAAARNRARAEKRRWAEQAEREAKKAAAERAAFPDALKSAKAAIRKAVRAGDNSVAVGQNRFVRERLEKLGYQTRYESETSNYGDSAAPCMIEEHYLIISW